MDIAGRRTCATCAVLLVGTSLAACRPRGEPPLRMNQVPGVSGIAPHAIGAGAVPEVRMPRTHARAHVLFGIDLSRPLHFPQCARFYNRFERPGHTCVYLRRADRKPFKIEFRDGAVPRFLKWNSALVATDARGRPGMVRFDIDNAPAFRGMAVDAMLAAFGPPTRVENAPGGSKVGTWQHEDYVVRYVFDAGGGGSVQMERVQVESAQMEPRLHAASNPTRQARR